MRIVVAKSFGIGNAVLTIPLLKALKSMGHRVEVLCGNTVDDWGAYQVFEHCDAGIIDDFRCDDKHPGNEKQVTQEWLNNEPDVFIRAIPYDQRWENLRVYWPNAKWIDGRKRPNNVERLGFDMWEKHEVLYQMEDAVELGYSGPVPSSKFLELGEVDPDLVYLGIGFKRDVSGFGLSKHYGNERYADLIVEIRKLHPTAKFVSTGGPTDLIQIGYQINRHLQSTDFYQCLPLSLSKSFEVISRCGSYIGNDTGFMHVAASLDMPTFGLTPYPDLRVKNPPLCRRGMMDLFGDDPKVVAQKFIDFVWG